MSESISGHIFWRTGTTLYLSLYLVLAASAVSVVTDLRDRKIPNFVTFPLALAALLVAAFRGPLPFLFSVGVMVGVMFLGFAAFRMGWLGGGDVKLLAASAGALVLHDVFAFIIYTSIAGGILAIVFAAIKGRLSEVLTSVSLIVRPFFYRGTVAVVPERSIRLPYGVAIAAGSVLVALSDTVAPFLRLPL